MPPALNIVISPRAGRSASPVGRLGRTSLVAFAVQTGGVGVSYLANLLGARLAGPEAYGFYAYVAAIVVIAAYVTALGYDAALLRFLPAYREQGAHDLVAGVVRFVERRVKAVSGGVIVLGLLGVLARWSGLSQEVVATLLLGLVLVPISALILIRSAVLRAFGHILTALAPDRLLRDGGLLCLLGLLALWGPVPVGAPVLMGATVVSSLATLALTTRASRRLCGLGRDLVRDPERTRVWRRAAYPFLALVVAEALINRVGVLLLGSFGHEAEAGCFALVANLAALVMMPRLAVNAMLTPMIAGYHARGDQAGLAVVVGQSTRWSLCGAMAIAVGLWWLGPLLLRWYGPGFMAGARPLGVLLIGQIIAASAGAQLQLLKMTGREIAAAKVLAASLAVNLAVGLVLVPPLGLMGAALANVACILTWNVAMIPLVWHHLGLKPSIIAWFFAERSRAS